MAFISGVSVGQLAVTGRGQTSFVCSKSCAVVSKRSTPVIQMAFSSLDAPERTVSKKLDSDVEDTLTAIYRQVFGNCYLMESDREELAVPESCFANGTFTVREFIRSVAKSETYRKRFFEPCSPYRFVELCTKHFLGRGPSSQKEISEHVQRLINDGYDADIDSYLDSSEYISKFGDNDVPRFVFLGTYDKNDSFNRLCAMRRDGCYTDTRSGSTAPRKPQKAELTLAEGWHVGTNKVSKGLPVEKRAVAPAPPRTVQ
mmetsp:Transcript_5080/g.8857  ORF Transcript_5080/g.8857 Transcript_5080/m.8857 type:complete len:258 (+) Transcript_5080:75-848(+)